jgi:hypothetical protein
MRRREHPLGESTALDIRSACDLAPDAYATRNARHHVLYDSIYHMFGTGRLTGARMLETACSFRVPPASTLTLMVGYRPPQMARAGSSVTLSIWAVPVDLLDRADVHFPEALGTVEFPPQGELRMTVADTPGLKSPAPTELAVDLSALAGKDVLLILRTQLDGEVEISDSDLEGFAVRLHDLRIVPVLTGARGSRAASDGRSFGS